MILLDTHALVWYVDKPARLSARARREIERHAARRELLVADISWWEIAMLAGKRRLVLDRPVRQWLQAVAELAELQTVGVTPVIAAASAELAGVMADPADCIICATAREWDCPLVSRDERMHAVKSVKVIW